MIPKIIAMYLPQFHQIPENDEFWGEGFTDWVTVKNAKPLFEGHQQPKVPLNDNYYDLSIKENVEWQCKLAKEYGVYGFGIYHYWFNNEKNLLTKPAEIIRDNQDIDINYFFAWDNLSWKRSWSNVKSANDWAPILDGERESSPGVLIPYILGNEDDWKNHYINLLSHFKDPRYIKKDNKPIFIIMHYSKDISLMCAYWNDLAKRDGFDGMFFIFNYLRFGRIPKKEYVFKYEPGFSGLVTESLIDKVVRMRRIDLKNYGGIKIVRDYDITWKRILKNARKMYRDNVYHCGLVSFDDTPRRGVAARLFINSSPSKFENYLSKLMKLSSLQNKEFVFITAWNEWGEGAYLEPDKLNGTKYLQAVKNVVDNFSSEF